ncbi:radical SAM family heme chaperone HemW [Paracoccus aerodenitrificans]|uniref:radical SAM family heme chaperone HemW n=1 Tax=Paracoccus aerodenitrificans TaxID=3017781 RepID=UPI0022EFE098|nr:radical SAM family heme chaperone HemW [Paracoccus aerodenitrificans]WBU65758.1 radical SAM family heme chaperone HemW [Paracoccus aerodenitrificans]
MSDWQSAGFGLYVHWPFCASKCPYCDFNSHVATSIDHTRWAEGYRREIARVGMETKGRVLRSIFFGGGTPSLMQPDIVSAVIEAAGQEWIFANDIEISMEANPGSVDAGRFAGYAQAGVNRLSLGVQALNDDDLRRLGRMHNLAEARRAFDIAKANFARVSFDLIYARQDQDLASWRTELTEALSMAVDHLSLYQLTIEDGTVFAARHKAGKLRGLPDDDVSADMYFETQDVLAAHGMPAYEISNHAAAGSESRHNLIYWRQGDWAAIGPGAHGRITDQLQDRYATVAEPMPEAWLDRVERLGSGDISAELLSQEEVATEYLLMSMRLAEGMDLTRFQAKGGKLDEPRVSRLVSDGLVILDGDIIRATSEGCPLLNYVLREMAG